MQKRFKNALVSTFASHYRLKLFRLLKAQLGTDCYFFVTSQQGTNDDIGHLNIHREDNFHYLSVGAIFWKLLTGGYDVIIKCTNNKWAFMGTFLIAKATNAKYIVWYSTWHFPRTLQYRLFSKFLLWLLKYHVDSIVVYGEHGKNFLVEQGIDPKKIFIAWQTVDNELFGRKVDKATVEALKEKLKIPQQKKVILYVGRLVKPKGLEYLLDALKLLKKDDVTFVAVGDGGMKAEIEKFCQDSKLDYRLVGRVPHSDLSSYYNIATLLVLPSITTTTFKEPWGLVVNEAFNQGCPVVVTDAVGAGMGGLVKNGVNGFVVAERNSDALAVAMNNILSDETLRQSLSHNALEEIKKWTYERQAKGFIDAIEYSLSK